MKNLSAFRQALGVLRDAKLSKEGGAFMDAVAELLEEHGKLADALSTVLPVYEAFKPQHASIAQTHDERVKEYTDLLLKARGCE